MHWEKTNLKGLKLFSDLILCELSRRKISKNQFQLMFSACMVDVLLNDYTMRHSMKPHLIWLRQIGRILVDGIIPAGGLIAGCAGRDIADRGVVCPETLLAPSQMSCNERQRSR